MYGADSRRGRCGCAKDPLWTTLPDFAKMRETEWMVAFERRFYTAIRVQGARSGAARYYQY